MNGHEIHDENKIRTFITAGNATFTVRNPETGNRFTFRVRVTKGENAVHFVNVLTGPDNGADFSRLGIIFADGRFVVPRAWEIGKDAPSAVAFAWIWRRLSAARDLGPAEVWHEGRCGACGRALTVPESIETGLGPVCARRAS